MPLAQSMVFAQQTEGKIVLEKPIDADYLKGSKKPYLLVFYGYVGCVKICTPVLDNLNGFYSSKDFARYRPYVDLTFVNLLPEVSKEQPELFAKSFNKEFRGVYLTQKELMSIDRELNVFFSKKMGEEYEIDHSDHVYLIKRESDGGLKLINIYTTHPLNHSLIIDDLGEYIKEAK